MISDVLADASAEIKTYQASMPDVYDDWTEEIDQVTQAMDALRIKFDTPPSLASV
jgi:hypothetical protein